MKSVVTIVNLPARSEILSKVAALTDGSISPDEASNWAQRWLLADQTPGTEVRIVDWPAWEAIKLLAGADLQVEAGSYLHGRDDFRHWLKNLQAAPLPGEKPTAPPLR